MAKCPHCPVRDRDEPCRAEVTKHWRYCALADPDDPAFNPAMVARLRGDVPKFPSLATQAANLAGAAVRFVASGGEMSTAEEQARRLGICADCDQFAEGRCRLCGCRLAAKVASAAEHCPLNDPKW